MITVNGKEYRNLQEQVEKNKQDIAAHYNVDRVLAEFGIRIQGQIDSAAQLPDPATYTGAFGDAYAVGTSEPYDFYIWTRANVDAGYPNNYWFNVGPLAIAGPQGPQGPAGPRGANGTDGNRWFSGTSFPETASAGDYFLNATTGAVYKYTLISIFPTYQYEWRFTASLRGPQGLQGSPGAPGQTGAQGPQGPQGPAGPVSSPVSILGILSSIDQLPDPNSVPRNTAYLIRVVDNAPPDLYIITGESDLTWTNSGGFGYGTTVLVRGNPVETFNADSKLNVIPTTGGVQIYANDISGNQVVIPAYSDQSIGSSAIIRGASGHHVEPTPTSRDHAANKGYVDDTITTSLRGYATTAYVDTVEQRLSGDINVLENNLEANDAKFEAYTPTIELDKQLDAKADKTDVNMRFNNVDYILGQFGIITAQEASGPTTGIDVPAKSAKVAAITEIGGATYKTVNLYQIPDITVSGSTAQTLSYTGDYELTPGTYSVSCSFTQTGDASIVKLSIRGYESFTEIYGEQTSTATVGTLTVTFTVPDGDRGCRIYVYSNATYVAAQTSATFSKFMLNAGAPQPYSEYFPGFRNAAATGVVSEGVNCAAPSKEYSIYGYKVSPNFDGSITISGNAISSTNIVIDLIDVDEPVKMNANEVYSYSVTKDGVSASVGCVFTYTDAIGGIVYGWNNQDTTRPRLLERIYLQFTPAVGGTDPNGTYYVIVNRGAFVKPYTPYIKRALYIPESVRPEYGIPNTDYYDRVRWRYDEMTDKWVRESEKCVGVVDMGTLTWKASSGTPNAFYTENILDVVPYRFSTTTKMICSKYEFAGTRRQESFFGSNKQLTCWATDGTGSNIRELYVKDTAYDDVATFKSAMSGVMLVYELSDPEVTDISELLPSNGLLGVQAGGTLTPVNEYNYPVPLNVEFQIINSSEVTSNE